MDSRRKALAGASEFERFHGIALARVLALAGHDDMRLAEMVPAEGWTSLVAGRGPACLIRHRPRARRLPKVAGAWVWRFAFTGEQMARMRRLDRRGRLRLVLVCGGNGGTVAEMALLEPDEVARLLDWSSFLEQRLTVQARPRKELWVSRHRVRVKVPRSRFPPAAGLR